jgi:esterase/lipase superfamily enzyme
MPTPVGFDATGIDPIAVTESREEGTTTRIFYATDRMPSKSPTTPATIYSNDRDFGLRLGVATVDLAPDLTWEELHEVSLQDKRTRNPTPRLTDVDEIGPLWLSVPPLDAASVEDSSVADAFAARVRADLAASTQNEIFIFVHGFNTRFDDNCVIAAELHHYLGSEGVFMSYAWPSRGSLFAYSKDKASAQYSIRYFRLFLSFLAERTDAARINVIAHSAGAPIAVGAIRELCLMHFDEDPDAVRSRYRLGRLVLVAPDMDLGMFANAVHDEIVGVPETMNIYISTRDRALDISSWIYGFARLGEPLTALRERDLDFLRDHSDVSIIDVAAAEKKHGSWLGHSYFHDDPWVSTDVILLLGHGAAPDERGLTLLDGKPIWTFPPDYPERCRAAVRRLYGEDGGVASDTPDRAHGDGPRDTSSAALSPETRHP